MTKLLLGAFLVFAAWAGDVDTAPLLPYKAVADWAKLPPGWNFGETSGVDVAPDGSIWVFNRGLHPVMQFAPDGRMLQAWNEVPVTSSHGLRVDPQGNVWLVDVAGHTVSKYTPNGRVLMVITQPGKSPGDNDSKYAFNRPTSLAFSPAGGFYVTDGYVNSRVIQYSSEGDYIRHWGTKGKGDGQFDLVHDVVLDKQGRLYVADRNNSRVQIFTPDGKFLGKWEHVGQPWGLAYVAADDAIFLCDGLNNRIVKVSTDGKVLGRLSGFGKVTGRLDFPHHMAVAPDGSIYVAEIKNWRVQKFVRE
jgi:DNA-binding beta-propeller fold protein YncE